MREFRQQFATNAACLEYLVRCRWTEGFVCPKCSGQSAWLNSKRYVFECRSCGRQTSPIAGTIMHRSHVPVQEWFWAAYLVATHTPGISALQLQRQLGIGNYRAAWHLLHRLRRGMINEERTRLSGLIEADETHIGGPAKGKTGRGVAAASTRPWWRARSKFSRTRTMTGVPESGPAGYACRRSRMRVRRTSARSFDGTSSPVRGSERMAGADTRTRLLPATSTACESSAYLNGLTSGRLTSIACSAI